MQCSQRCGRPAFVQMDGGRGQVLCLEHYAMFMTVMNVQQQNHMAMMNYYRDQIHETMGVPPPRARIRIPQPVINNSPVYNNISIDRSVVGSINTAQVERIDVAMENIKNTGHDDVNDAIKALTEAVIKSESLRSKEKEQVVEELAFIAEQAALPEHKQQKHVVRLMLKAIPTSFTALADLTTLWTTWEPVLRHAFLGK